MGGNSNSLPKFNWTFIRRDDHHEVYQNQFGALAEKNTILNNPRLDEKEELQTYYYRYSTKKPIVRAYRADYDKSDGFCSNHKNITVFTEYIPFRLIDTRNLSHQQGLYVLSEALHGFHELFVKLGAFKVEDTMVGFNKDGFVKVWHNPDFAQNHFQSNGVVLMSTINPHQFDTRVVTKQQEEMAQDIWWTVDKHATFLPDFRNYVQSVQPLNFYNLRDVVDEAIAKSPYVPSHLNFEDRHGIIRSSRQILGQSQMGYNRGSFNSYGNQNLNNSGNLRGSPMNVGGNRQSNSMLRLNGPLNSNNEYNNYNRVESTYQNYGDNLNDYNNTSYNNNAAYNNNINSSYNNAGAYNNNTNPSYNNNINTSYNSNTNPSYNNTNPSYNNANTSYNNNNAYNNNVRSSFQRDNVHSSSNLRGSKHRADASQPNLNRQYSHHSNQSFNRESYNHTHNNRDNNRDNYNNTNYNTNTNTNNNNNSNNDREVGFGQTIYHSNSGYDPYNNPPNLNRQQTSNNSIINTQNGYTRGGVNYRQI